MTNEELIECLKNEINTLRMLCSQYAEIGKRQHTAISRAKTESYETIEHRCYRILNGYFPETYPDRIKP